MMCSSSAGDGGDDDDDFFTPTRTTSASHLASLFGVSWNPSLPSDPCPSLIYTAPKQPKSPDADQIRSKQRPQNKVICVKTVQLYKISNSTSDGLGKHGIAIIGDPDIDSCNLLIYKTKQNIVSMTAINVTLVYTPRDDQTASFKDGQKNAWRVQFDNAKDGLEFLQVLEAKGASINTVIMPTQDDGRQEDILSEGSQARANILERISKVGQSMLPTVKNADLGESETDEIVKAKKAVRKPKRHSTSDTYVMSGADFSEPIQQCMVPMSGGTMHQQQFTLINGQYVPSPMIQQVMPVGDPFSLHFTENRMHNSEVRINLSQLSTKLDSVLSEINCIKTVSYPETTVLRNRIDELEIKLHSLTSLKKVDPVQPDEEDLQDEKVSELVNKLTVVEIELTESRLLNHDLQETIDVLNKQIYVQTSQLDEFKKSKSSAMELEAIVAKQLVKLDNLEAKINNDKQTMESMNETISNLQKTVDEQNVQLAERAAALQKLVDLNKLLDETVAEQLSKLGACEEPRKYDNRLDATEDKTKVFAETVKDIMNTMYQNILEKYGEDERVHGFKRILSQYMKTTTFHIIEEYKNSISELNSSRRTEDVTKSNITPPPIPEFEITV